MTRAKTVSIYELMSLKHDGRKSRRDGSYGLYETLQGFFSTREKAEAFMRRVVEEGREWAEPLFAFLIYEHELDGNSRLAPEERGRFQAVWSYLGDGTFYCHSDCDEGCVKPFRGRRADTIMLKPGDLAWHADSSRLVPCIVEYTPMTDTEYRRKTKRLGHEMKLDYFDDSYFVYHAIGGHCHPNTWCVFPFSGKISQRHLDAILTSRQEEQSWRPSNATT